MICDSRLASAEVASKACVTSHRTRAGTRSMCSAAFCLSALPGAVFGLVLRCNENRPKGWRASRGRSTGFD